MCVRVGEGGRACEEYKVELLSKEVVLFVVSNNGTEPIQVSRKGMWSGRGGKGRWSGRGGKGVWRGREQCVEWEGHTHDAWSPLCVRSTAKLLKASVVISP